MSKVWLKHQELIVSFIILIVLKQMLLTISFLVCLLMKTPILCQHLPQEEMTSLLYYTYITVIPAIVFDELHSLKSNKSCGPDGWPPVILRNCAEHLYVPLSMLFNKSLETGLLPKD